MKNKIIKNTIPVETIPKSNIKILERGKIDTRSTPIVTVHFPGLVQALQ